jgi:hypothetical protein
MSDKLSSRDLPLINNDRVFSTVSIPPMIGTLDKCVRILVAGLSTLSSARGAVVPKILKSTLDSSLLQQGLVVNFSQVGKVLYLYVRIDVVELASLRLLKCVAPLLFGCSTAFTMGRFGPVQMSHFQCRSQWCKVWGNSFSALAHFRRCSFFFFGKLIAVIAFEQTIINEFFASNVQFSKFLEVPFFHAVVAGLGGRRIKGLRFPVGTLALRRMLLQLGETVLLLKDHVALNVRRSCCRACFQS